MLEQFRFYFRHSFNDLWVSKRLTFFALLSIAAGVAAIVSLQTLAVMIGDTLQVNLQETNRGDISISLANVNPEDELIDQGLQEGVLAEQTTTFFGQDTSQIYISGDGLETIRQWMEGGDFAGQIDMTYRIAATDFLGMFAGTGTGTAMSHLLTGEQVAQISPVIIDVGKYPFYSEIVTEDGQLLSDLIQSPTDIVVSDKIARDLGVEAGALVQLNGSRGVFTVRGVVATETEVKNPLTDIFAGLFGFYYLDHQAVSLFEDLPVQADFLYFQLDDPDQLAVADGSLSARFPYFNTATTDDLRQSNEDLVEQIAQLVTIMGLVSLLIGSIGIVNTMQVIVRRRMVEVAVLKTIGLQAGQVTLLFLTEAFIMGIIGALVGIVLGWGATFAIKGVAETLFATDLPFRIAPAPAVNGFVVGVLVTTVFGFLPTLTAGQVRPGIVLRPAGNVIPNAGRVRSLLALVLIIVVLSLIAQSILGSLSTALIVVTGAFIAAGFLYLLLSLLIWVIGRLFPSLGVIDLKIALRQMVAGRARGASTLLALVIGVFSLSLITLFTESINGLLQSVLTDSGGNVLVFAQGISALAPVEAVLDTTEGVNDYIVTLAYSMTLVSFEDADTGQSYDLEGVRQRLRDADLDFPPFFQGSAGERDEIQQPILDGLLLNTSIEARALAGGTESNFIEGRDLTASDSGQAVMVITDNEMWAAIGLTAGDKLTYEIKGRGGLLSAGEAETVTFELVGIKQQSMVNVSFSNVSSYAPMGAFPESVSPTTVSLLVDVDEERIAQLRRELSSVPGTFVLETAVFTRLISSLIGTFTAFPSMVAALGLVVGGVVIANSVALTTMERRREIAVMKSIGLQRARVLAMLLLENGILGLIGGLIGVGIGLVALAILVGQTDAPVEAVPYATGLLLMLLCIVVALVAALTSAWGASGEKPLNVLRYE